MSITTALLVALVPSAISAQRPSRVLFENVRIFNGTSTDLSGPSYVLVENNKIQTISAEPIVVHAAGSLTTIDGNGRTLMPGLSDAHWHFNHALIDLAKALNPSISNQEADVIIRASSQTAAEEMLMRGVTSARDAGGNVFWLKNAIDSGNVAVLVLAFGPATR